MRDVRPDGSRRWQGEQDLARLQSATRCAAPDPRRFRAEERVLTAGGITLRDWLSTELSGVAEPAAGTSLQIAVVLAGQARWATSGQRWSGGPRSAHLLCDDEQLMWSIAHGTRVVRVALPVAQLPAHLRPLASGASGAIPDSRLVSAYVATLEQAVGAAADAPGAVTYLCRGLHNMALALLEDLPVTEHAGGPDLRPRILAHIEHHLDDPALNPRSIAAAFGISLRWVHQAFNTTETSLARHIRHRRVDSIAEILRAERRTPRTGLLATRFGFSGREQLARCFRARYGVTVTAYHGLVVDGLPLPQPVDEQEGLAEEQVA